MLLDNAGGTVPDRFATLPDDAPAPPSGGIIVSLARLRSEPALLEGARDLGVILPGGTDLATFASDLPAPGAVLSRFAVIAVSFPVFRDGRGFTLARALREEYGYEGEIRATGHVLPDQYVFLVRCGVSTVEVPDGTDVAVWAAALHRQSHPDQPAAERPATLLRRIALPFAAG